ncbi:MAG: endonuclease domain-containing protein [Candidatus Melainabacteria bacterium]
MEATQKARLLRHRETPAEQACWLLIRNRQVMGYKFYRQKPVEYFVVDFYCPELRLVLELDGSVHNLPDVEGYDRERQAILEAMGYVVIRYANAVVLNSPECFLSYLKTTIERLTCSPSPLGERGLGGEG